MRIRTVLLAAALACGLASGAAEDAGRAILLRAESVRNPPIDYAVEFRLDVEDDTTSWRKRFATYTLVAHGRDESLVLMREPEGFYPSFLLIDREHFWVILPRAAHPFELAPRYVKSGDIAHGDLARANLPAHYEARLDGEEAIRGEACQRLELSRKGELGLFPRIRYWVTREGSRPRKLEFFGDEGAPVKTAYYEDYREGRLGLRPMRVEVESALRPSERSTLTFSDLRPFDARGLSFRSEALPALRDAAAASASALGRQPSAEELAARLAGQSGIPSSGTSSESVSIRASASIR